ncbi:PEP-CTERM sorting domain-containing protein [Bowmanella pacifica]|uniref:Ice-binding protein C-terminal domain-containing protein n=1 Tax=Bowmanella pacifica TaxID=502051 RepID=A0A917YZB9_9ALTE|nr:PEP-CTERM sorting domain-containing protein [Bowmanella pacifica]GGO70324.1 hypothetical protein GCM10010982_23550 [Bowmanella pacifica]
MLSKKLLNLIAAVAFLSSLSSHAALIVGANDELLGATGVTVGSYIYDVSFIDGSCQSVYSGCNEISDFTFQDLASANQASQALLDQVFLGIYDTIPSLINGCTASEVCFVATAYGFNNTSTQSASARNADTINDMVAHPSMSTHHDHSNPSNGSAARVTFAKWSLVGLADIPSQIPEPSVWILMLLGLASLGMSRRRAKQ